MSFWKDVNDLRKATQANVEAGRGNRSLIEAMEQMKERPAADPAPPKSKRRHLRTFAIFALIGAIWQGTRR